MRSWLALLFFVAAAAVMPFAADAAGATPYWSESYAERVLLAKLHVPCATVRKEKDCNLAAAQKEKAAFERRIADCQALATPDARLSCLKSIGTQTRDPDLNLSQVKNGFPLEQADCVGGGKPDRSGFRFAQFRCKIKVIDEDILDTEIDVTGRILVTPTGPTTFRWRLI